MPSRKSIANEEDWGDQPALFDTSVKIFRYLVVISPSQEMIAEIARLKRKILERIGGYRGDRSVAHMTFLFAYLPIEYERDLIEGITMGVQDRRAIKMEFEGIHHFPDRSSIFIQPKDEKPLIELRKSIRRSLHSNKQLKRLGIHPTSSALIYVARKLSPDQFDRAWSALFPHHFDRTETVNEVILLRSGLKEGDRHQIVGRFTMNADPASPIR